MTKGDGKPCKRCGTSEWDGRGNCKKCSADRVKDWYRRNPEKRRENVRRWRTANPEKTAEQNRQWDAGNRESRRAAGRQRYRNNPDKHREYSRQWKADNPEKHAANENRRRTQKTEAGGSYTAAEWKALCKQYDNRCACCGEKKKLTFDHVIPVSKGGSSNISNGQPLCQSCNSRKGDSVIDYRTKSGILRWFQEKLL